jgi:RNA polymerase sigma factor (sigma-70 family)
MLTMPRSRLDADRLAAAYDRDARRLLVFFTRRTYDAQLALDLVGETYARAFELRGRFAGDAGDMDALAAWMFGIARNVLNEALRRGAAERRALRRAGVQAPTLHAEELVRIEELAGLGELRTAVAAALAELADEQREAVRLRVVEELDYADVAGRLGISEQAARARVSRGLRALAAALDGLGPAEATS